MLELQNIGLTVRDAATGEDRTLLQNITHRIESGKFTVITGPNGGGKSTLAKLIMGMERPTTGRILFEGRDITHLSIPERAAQGIGFAFQQPVRFKGLQVCDLLRMAAGRDLSIPEACDYLSRVGLCAMEYVKRELNDSLSGGEMKRIEIAMLMARNVKFSIFDEPEAGIDLWSFSNLISIFEELREETEGSILIISHQERILEIADEIIVMRGGEIADFGGRDKLLPELLGSADVCDYTKRGLPQ